MMTLDSETDEERYTEWRCEPALPFWMNVLKVVHTGDDLRVSLQEEIGVSDVVTIHFRDFIAYRNVRESFHLDAVSRVELPPRTMRQVENSRWIRWLRVEACGVLDSWPLMHFAILTDDDWIEVGLCEPPTVTWSPYVDDGLLDPDDLLPYEF